MRLYELITFTVRVRTPTVALARIEAALAQSLDGVELMGCWLSEIGPQNRIVLLRGFPRVKHCARPNVSVICWLTMPSVSANSCSTCRPTTTACFPSSSPWLPAPTGLSTNCVNTI